MKIAISREVEPLYRAIEAFGVEVVNYRNMHFHARGLLTKASGKYHSTYDGDTMIGVWYAPDFENQSRIWKDEKDGVGVLMRSKRRSCWCMMRAST